MKFAASQTDIIVNRIVKAVQLPTDDPFYKATERLVDLMRKKQEEGSWNP